MSLLALESWFFKFFGEKTINFILGRSWIKGALSFNDVVLTYSFSYYDEKGNHLLKSDLKKIYSIQIGATCCNKAGKPRIMRNTQLVAMVNSKIYRLDMRDLTKDSWESIYNIAPNSACRFSWSAYTLGSGPANENGMIPLKEGENEIDFKVCYIDERDKTRNIPVSKIEVRRMNPRRLGNQS